MEPVVDVKLKYVARERMANGKFRYRFQRGGKKTTINGEPGTPEFLQRYTALLDGVEHVTPDRLRSGSIAQIVGLFLRDVESRVASGLASPLTLKGHRHHLGYLVSEYGEMDARIPRGKLVQFLDQFSSTPGARDNRRKSISALYEWALEREYLDPSEYQNPAKTIRKINKGGTGFYTCTIEDVRAYMRTHGPGTTARRVMIVELCTAARREDLRLLGPFNEFKRSGAKWLRWTQSKAPNRTVEIPMLPMLAEEVSGVRDGTYITTTRGTPMTHGTIGNYVRQWFDDAGVKGSLHGVRKGLSSILPHLGATSYELDVLLGHELGSDQTKVYVAEAERAQIAETLGEKMARVKW